MIQSAERIEPEVDRTRRILDEYRQYRQRKFQNLDDEINWMRMIAEEESISVTTQANQESAAITATACDEAEQVVAGEKDKASVESDRIIAEARRQAEQISKASAEMKQKLSREVEEIRKDIHAEAEQIIMAAVETAREQAQKESDAIVAKARKTAEDIVLEAERAQKERNQLLADSVIEARRKSGLEAAQIIAEARQTAERIVAEASSKVRVEMKEPSRLIAGMKQRLGRVIEATVKESRKPDSEPGKPARAAGKKDNAAETGPVAVANKKEVRAHAMETEPVRAADKAAHSRAAAAGAIAVKEDNGRTYQGRLELFMAPSPRVDQIANFEKYLLQMPHLRLVGKGSSADGKTWTEVEISEPLPLLEFLKRMPLVKDVMGSTDNITVAFIR